MKKERPFHLQKWKNNTWTRKAKNNLNIQKHSNILSSHCCTCLKVDVWYNGVLKAPYGSKELSILVNIVDMLGSFPFESENFQHVNPNPTEKKKKKKEEDTTKKSKLTQSRGDIIQAVSNPIHHSQSAHIRVPIPAATHLGPLPRRQRCQGSLQGEHQASP